MGSDVIAVPALEWLCKQTDSVRVAGVVSQPDRPVGRGKKLTPNPLAAAATVQGVPLLQPEKPGDELVRWLQDEQVQLVFVMAYGHILRNALLETPPMGCVNFHASILPKYRGASPINGAIANGESETGVSLMRIVQKMDAGAVCDVEKVAIAPDDTAATVWQKLAQTTVPLLERQLDNLLAGSAVFVEQDDAAATYTRKLTKHDGQVDFSLNANALSARSRALHPWPGTFFDHGDVRLKALPPRVLNGNTSALAGQVVEASDDGVTVACADGSLVCFTHLQRPGARMLPAADFLRGYPLEAGAQLSGAPAKPLVRTEQ